MVRDETATKISGNYSFKMEEIKKRIPEVYSAIEITNSFFELSDIRYTYFKKDNMITLSLDKNNNLDIRIDFNNSCAFFVKHSKHHGTMRIFFSVYSTKGFVFPTLNLENIEDWMFKVVYDNYVFEKNDRMKRG